MLRSTGFFDRVKAYSSFAFHTFGVWIGVVESTSSFESFISFTPLTNHSHFPFRTLTIPFDGPLSFRFLNFGKRTA